MVPMKPEKPKYEDQSADYADQQGVGARAGVFLLEGRFHVAGHASLAERRLLDRGALLVATLSFDPVDGERLVSGGSTGPYAFTARTYSPFQVRREAVRLGRLSSRN